MVLAERMLQFRFDFDFDFDTDSGGDGHRWMRFAFSACGPTHVQ
jgi:hypothetical protein